MPKLATLIFILLLVPLQASALQLSDPELDPEVRAAVAALQHLEAEGYYGPYEAPTLFAPGREDAVGMRSLPVRVVPFKTRDTDEGRFVEESLAFPEGSRILTDRLVELGLHAGGAEPLSLVRSCTDEGCTGNDVDVQPLEVVVRSVDDKGIVLGFFAAQIDWLADQPVRGVGFSFIYVRVEGADETGRAPSVEVLSHRENGLTLYVPDRL